MNFLIGLDPQPEAAREAILEGILQYNERFLGPRYTARLVVTARDEAGTVVAGAVGAVHYDRLAIDLLWVDEGLRGGGLGSRVLLEMESQGKENGARRCFLDTFTFQAAPFYTRHGYVEIARIPRYFGEYDRIYLLKDPL